MAAHHPRAKSGSRGECGACSTDSTAKESVSFIYEELLNTNKREACQQEGSGSGLEPYTHKRKVNSKIVRDNRHL